jgi:hypothetical protein
MRLLLLPGVVCVVACSTDPDAGDPMTGGRRLLAHVEVAVYQNVAAAPPVAGAPVAFVNLDGTGTVIVTDPDGIARGDVDAGGSVTALVPLVPADNPPYLSTVLAVQDGDHLNLGFAPVEVLPSASGTPACDDVAFVARYTNVDPSNVLGIYAHRATESSNGTFAGTDAPAAPIAELSLAGPGGMRASIETSFRGPMSGYQQWMRDVIPGCATSYELDLATQLLPWIGVPTLDVDHGIVRVPFDGVGGGDYLQLAVSYQRDDHYVNWAVIAPHAGDVLLPDLPGELADLMPRTGDVPGGTAAQLVDDDAIQGYDEARINASGGAIGVGSRQSTARVRSSYRIVGP